MSTTGWIVLVVVVLVLLAVLAGAWYITERRRRQRQEELRERFGPEYDRAVSERGRREGERELGDIAERRERVDIRPLRPGERERYAAEWELLQARFVDDPSDAVDRADGLVTEVMRERGYPVDDFGSRSDMVAADHAEVAQAYRAAHDVRQLSRESDVGTEPLREALVRYRTLFDLLLREGKEQGRAGEPRIGGQPGPADRTAPRSEHRQRPS